MTWTHHHRRAEVLRAVIRAADERMDGVVPMDVDGVDETFVDELTLVGALQLRWHTRLVGQIELALDREDVDPLRAVIHAWRVTAEALPGIRAILDQAMVEPSSHELAAALAKAVAKEHAMVAIMAGVAAAPDAAAVSAGEQVEFQARMPRGAGRHGARAFNKAMMRRIKAVLAA